MGMGRIQVHHREKGTMKNLITDPLYLNIGGSHEKICFKSR